MQLANIIVKTTLPITIFWVELLVEDIFDVYKNREGISISNSFRVIVPLYFILKLDLFN